MKYKRRDLFKAGAAVLLGSQINGAADAASKDQKEPVNRGDVEPINGRWTIERVNQWYSKQPWMVGCNYVPTYAINQIEMWQGSTFNPKIIDSELGLAESIGFNTIRIFAHDLVWKTERNGYFNRIRQFLDICEKHHIRVIYTIFTNGGTEPSAMGPQPAPVPGLHNGGWRQTPGVSAVMNQPEKWGTMESYVKDTISTFAEDSRILFWDIFNEPSNNKAVKDIAGFVRLAFSWARQIAPPQPLTSAFLTYKLDRLNAFLAENCDFMSFHNYGGVKSLQSAFDQMKVLGRPIVCKEWLARHLKSTIQDCLPFFKKNNIGAINWGLIPGKLQTHIPWKYLLEKFPDSKKIWFHDLFDEKHRPYDPKEIELIMKLSGKKS
ncbi:MAG: cellulase family glycosylhydrolase [Planctomycetia bacterium]|nr:cellulase family glycosylhydrolase [Planctomycetia bacterium]